MTRRAAVRQPLVEAPLDAPRRGRTVKHEDLRPLQSFGAGPVHPIAVAGIAPAAMSDQISKFGAAQEAAGRVALARGVGYLKAAVGLLRPVLCKRRRDREQRHKQDSCGTERSRHYAACCATVGPSLLVVVRRTSRTMLRSSKRRTRCMVVRLSQITRSNGVHLWT